MLRRRLGTGWYRACPAELNGYGVTEGFTKKLQLVGVGYRAGLKAM